MLDQNDVKQIGKIVREEIRENNKEIVLQVGEMIEQNVLPHITALDVKVNVFDEKITALDGKMNTLDGKVDTLDGKVNALPNRDFFERQTATANGEVVASLRKEDEKVNLHIKFSHEKKVLTDAQRDQLRALHVFPTVGV